jgi:hypothetical protein
MCDYINFFKNRLCWWKGRMESENEENGKNTNKETVQFHYVQM